MSTKAASFFDHEGVPSFEEEWPELARRLERLLAAKGVERWLRADVIQETAARLYPRWETLDHSLPVWNLVATIASRVVQNHRRKESRIELVPDPVPAHIDDVHVRGLQRAQLDKTRSALQHLSSDQRRVLLAELGEAVLPVGTRNRLNVVRSRARAKLREALGPWAPSAIALRFRCLRDRIVPMGPALEMYTPAMASSLMNVAVVATLGLAGVAADDANPVARQRARVMSSAELRGIDLDSVAGNRRPGRSGPSRSSDRARKASDGTSGAAADGRDEAEGLDEWADRQKEVVENQKEEAEEQKEVLEDQADEVHEQKEEVDEQREVVEEQLPP